MAAQLERIFGALLHGQEGHSFTRESCYKLVSAASELADEMKSVPAKYVLTLNNDAIGQSRISLNDRESYKIFDAVTGFLLRPIDETPTTENGDIGTKLTCFSPSLIRKGSDGEPDVVLRKADLLAIFDKKVGRGGRRT